MFDQDALLDALKANPPLVAGSTTMEREAVWRGKMTAPSRPIRRVPRKPDAPAVRPVSEAEKDQMVALFHELGGENCPGICTEIASRLSTGRTRSTVSKVLAERGVRRMAVSTHVKSGKRAK